MKKKIMKLTACIIIVFGFITTTGAGLNASTSTNSEAYIPSETTVTEEVATPIAGVSLAMTEALAEVEISPKETPIVLAPSEVTRVKTRDKGELESLISSTNEKLQAANDMLESCKTLGYDDDNPVVVLANEEVANAKADMEYYQTIYDEVLIELRAAERMAEYPVATTIWNYLKDLGYNDYVAAGILGNIMAEVGGQTLAIQPTLSNGTYYGMCQWKICYYPSVSGLGTEGQLDLLANTIEQEFNEFGYVSGYSYEEFLNIQDEQTAALAFAKTYERCGSGSHSVRQKNATKALEYFTN